MTFNQHEKNFLFKNREILKKSLRENPTFKSGEINEINIQLTRQLLHFEREKDPENRDVWIASTHLEIACGNIEAAQNMILLGCESLHNDEELWLKAVNMHKNNPITVKNIIERAIGLNPTSAKLWLEAANLETDVINRRKVFREAFMQNFDRETSTFNEGLDRFLFGCFLIWPHEETRYLFDNLLIDYPCDERLWLALARFEGLSGKVDQFEVMFDRALITMADNGYSIMMRDEWIKEAIIAEGLCSIKCCQTIMNAIMAAYRGNCVTNWIDIVDFCISKNAYECAYAIYDFLYRAFPNKTEVLLRVMFNESELDLSEDCKLTVTVLHCLTRAKINWRAGNYENARGYFMKAFKEDSVVKNKLSKLFLQFSYDDVLGVENARSSLWRVICFANDAWRLDQPEIALKLLNEHTDAIDYKLWKLKGQIEAQEKDYESAKNSFETAIKLKGDDFQLWLLLANLEEKRGNLPEARKVLKCGRKSLQAQIQDDVFIVRFFLATIRLELRAGNNNVAHEILRYLLDNSQFSLIALSEAWIEAITMEPRKTKELKIVDALQKCEYHRYVMFEAVKILFSQGKVKKCRKWFEKTVAKWPKFGDAWAYFYKLEKIWGTKEKVEDVRRRFLAAGGGASYYGAVWFEYREKFENRFLTNEDLLEKIAECAPFPGTVNIQIALSSVKCEDHRCCFWVLIP